MKSPPKPLPVTRVNVAFTAAQLRALDRLCAQSHRSRPSMVRTLILTAAARDAQMGRKTRDGWNWRTK